MIPFTAPSRPAPRGARALLATAFVALTLVTATSPPADGRPRALASGTPTTAVRPVETMRTGPVDHLYGSPVRKIPTEEKLVALTFNAAWNESGLDAVLKVLRQQKAPATFFLTGQFAERHPDAARSIAAAGHGIGNHSHSHPRFEVLTPAERAQEVHDADTAIRAATATQPLPFFRFPYGSAPAAHVTQVNRLGYADIEYTADTNGYKGTAGGMTVQKTVTRALDALVPGEIIQMHVGSLDGHDPVLDAQALPQIIDALHTRGYQITDLRTLLQRENAWGTEAGTRPSGLGERS
ncbi:polysaccharide deacetylase family protein [Streptomyces sp. NPDC041068]|uniref:polysaccharide deacetylase family protein n=1 Tax=Streptomyces sp. NPDC041068 TaxID=3155130 RepID=UPI0033DC9794